MSTKDIVLKWGAIGSLGYLSFGFLGYLLNIPNSKIMIFLVVLVTLATILYGLFDYTDKIHSGFATFKKLVGVGLMIGLIIVVVSTLWAYIYPMFLDSNYLDSKIEVQLESFRKYGMLESELEETREILKSKSTPFYNALINLANMSAVVLFITTIASGVIKKEKPLPELNTEEH